MKEEVGLYMFLKYLQHVAIQYKTKSYPGIPGEKDSAHKRVQQICSAGKYVYIHQFFRKFSARQ